MEYVSTSKAEPTQKFEVDLARTFRTSFCGPLAQLVEHRTFNPGVGGSIPPWLTTRVNIHR